MSGIGIGPSLFALFRILLVWGDAKHRNEDACVSMAQLTTVLDIAAARQICDAHHKIKFLSG